ncbi:glycosyltransferase family protein [Neomicrococcus lactis]|uniref:Glycosyltransferase n=1 Tax=Neomicrococcus lactis TaxID=732241 RepID=A0A7W9DAD2_9MICC|nr:hypothetical protein [Neomicrococcus lactis]MBB5597528.1 hypothetical protein [Neomicrococcus lactis]
MKLALFAEGVGPAEAMIIDNAKANGHEVSIFRPADNFWLTFARGRAPQVHPQVFQTIATLPSSIIRRTEIQRALETLEVDFVIGTGLAGASVTAATVAGPSASVLFRGDLDFSSARGSLSSAFQMLNDNGTRIFLDDEFEMDKALGKGSRLPHLLNPRPILGRSRVLARRVGKHVGILFDPQLSEESIDIFVDNLKAVVGDEVDEITPLAISSLYSRHEIRRKNSLSDNLHSRLGQFTHLVFLGSSRDAGPVLAALKPDWDKIAVEATVGMRGLCERIGFTNLARGVRLVQVTADVLHQPETDLGDLPPAIEDSSNEVSRDFAQELFERWAKPVSWDYEELAALQSDQPLNVFYSVGSLSDDSSGARPQRVRNMAREMEKLGPTIRMFSTGNNTARRSRLVSQALAKGRKAGVFYGENSTSPLAEEDVLEDLVSTISKFRAAGGQTAWFVRDMHWLEEKFDIWTDSKRAALVRSGRRELERLESVVEVLAAPSKDSGEGFNEMLKEHNHQAIDWLPLPPGVALENVPEGRTAIKREGTTLLYAGGIGDIYGMDNYLEAAAKLAQEGYFLDFVVRAREVDSLFARLHELGLKDDSAVRIIHADLENYIPRTELCIGTILLDSDYARFAFPYKTMSMIERRFPILTYADMSIASFVEEASVGVKCERSVESIMDGVKRIESSDHNFTFEEAQKLNSWGERLRSVFQS